MRILPRERPHCIRNEGRFGFFEVSRNQAEMRSRTLVLATADGKTERGERAEKSESGGGRFVSAAHSNLSAGATCTSLGGAGTIAALRVAVGITGDFDLERFLQCRNASIEFVPDLDILTIAEQRPIGPATSRLTTTLKIGFAHREALVLAIELALHVGISVARTGARRLALRVAIGTRRRGLTARVTFAITSRLALRTAPIGIGGTGTSCVAISRAARFARCSALEFGRIHHALRLACGVTTRRACGSDHRIAPAIAIDIQLGRALCGKADRRAGRHAPTVDSHFAFRIGVDLDETTRLDNSGSSWSGKTQKRGGQSSGKDGGKEVTHDDSPGSPDKVRFASTHRHRLSAPNVQAGSATRTCQWK